MGIGAKKVKKGWLPWLHGRVRLSVRTLHFLPPCPQFLSLFRILGREGLMRLGFAGRVGFFSLISSFFSKMAIPRGLR